MQHLKSTLQIEKQIIKQFVKWFYFPVMDVAYSRFTFPQVIVINSVQSINNSDLKALEKDQRQTCLEGRSSLKAGNCSWRVTFFCFCPGGAPPSTPGTVGTPAESWGTTGWQSQETVQSCQSNQKVRVEISQRREPERKEPQICISSLTKSSEAP